MHAIVYNKSPSLLINPACCGDSVCVRRPRVPLIVFPGPTGRFATTYTLFAFEDENQ